jgi:hypothetical protein
VKFADIGATTDSPVRFPWTHTDAARGPGNAKQFTATVPRHGVVLLRIGRLKKSS